MKRLAALVGLLLFLAAMPVSAAMTVTLTSPPTPCTAVHITLMTVQPDAGTVYFGWTCNDGKTTGTAQYSSIPAPVSKQTGAMLIHALNTGDFSVTPLETNIIQLLQHDGYIGAGTIGGAPN